VELSHDEVLKMAEVSTQSPTPPPKSQGVRKEIVGDGEEVEVEPGEDLNENQLAMIYNRYLSTVLAFFRAKLMLLQGSTARQNHG
jgi:hypothetical protein